MKKNNAEIYVKNVSKQFKEIVALNNVSVQFQSGKLYGLIGPAGAGKTTLFRVMLGLMKESAGNIFYKKNGNKIRWF